MRVAYPTIFLCALIVSTILLTHHLSAAQDSPALTAKPKGYEERLDKFWALLEGGRPLEALSIAKPDDMSNDDYAALQKKFQEITAALGGKCTGHYKLSETAFGDHVTTLFFLAYYEKLPLVVDLTFYNSNGKWICINANFKARPSFFRDISRTRMGAADDTSDNQTSAGEGQN